MAAAVMIREAVVKYRGPRRRAGESMRSPTDVARFIRGVVGNDAREHFVTVMLDGRHRPIGYQRVSIGTATAALVHPREVFQTAVGLGAVALIVAHNHPSGDPSPSREDREVVERLVRAGTLLGIPLLDSVVVADGGYHSMREAEPSTFTGAAAGA
jgi:DNA repair protein RadC